MLLNCHTYFSLRYGTLSVEQLMDEVKAKGYDAYVLSDINNTSATLDSLRIQKEKKELNVIPGIDFRNGIKQTYIGIAKNNAGFRELNEYLTRHLHSETEFEKEAPPFKNAYIVYPLSAYAGKTLGDHEFIGVSAKELEHFSFLSRKQLHHKMVVLQTTTFLHKKHFNAHRLLRAIDQNTLLSKLPSNEQTSEDEKAPFKEEVYQAFAAYPEIIQNTERILETCKVDFEFGKLTNKNLKHYSESKEGDIRKLRELAYQGLGYRYTDSTEKILERLEKELEVIALMNFASYYLINWDIIQYARSKGYFYVGRGSGANSLVAYLLNITDVDPIELDLYFERFINIHRANAPDFDIDFSWTDRDDITQYIFNRFGRERTALLGTYSTFQSDATIRELGKVFGLPPHEIDKLQKNGKADKDDQIGKLIITYSEMISGFPNHISIHASGILISEEPITTYTATLLPPKGYPTTQFSMLEAEDIGLFKFDILSQRGLGKIKDAIEIIRKNRGDDIDIHDVKKFKNDEEIKKLLSVGKCIGCFYVESPAMRMLLAKLRADDYLRLVAASSIIRPGVSKSGMMREYILRYRDENVRRKAQKEIPLLYDLLEETYGVMVYQEDVIKIAHLFAGLSLAEADYLRRGMSWKFKQRNEFWRVKEKFFNNCLEKKYEHKVINDIWVQIESFANFAFSKGHSASYAVESYQALYLKAHYPLEYMVATLNNGGGFYRKDVYIHEARMHGAKIVPPCINTSTVNCEIKGDTIFLGFDLVSELEKKLVEKIIEERNSGGSYTSLYNFIKRTAISIEQLRILIRSGAFGSINKNKKELLWEAHMLVNPVKHQQPNSELFEIEPQKFKLPQLENTWLDDAFDEIELFGFSLCHPFKLLKEPVKNTLTSPDLKHHIGSTVEIIGHLVNVKTTWTGNKEKMHFGTFLDAEGYWIDTVHFPPSTKAHAFTGPGSYRIIGKVTEEFDFICIDVLHLSRLPMISKDDAPEMRVPPRERRERVYQRG